MKQQHFQSARRMSTVSSLDEVQFLPDTIFVYSEGSGHDRANVEHWAGTLTGKYEHFAASKADGDLLMLRNRDGKDIQVNMKDVLDLRNLFPPNSNVVVDISGIEHDFWAGCLYALRGYARTLTYIYTEPNEYQFRDEPERVNPFDLFDLSPRTRGLRALSGFANLDGPGRRPSLFVPLLGFEGQRALNVLNEIDPGPAVTVPVMGVPGYQIQFPAYTAYCNKVLFEQTLSYRKWHIAPANDPFALQSVLDRIDQEHPNHYMYVAPIGTRPHALGSLLYVQKKHESSEVLFDHPVSKEGSRMGKGPSHLYCIFP